MEDGVAGATCLMFDFGLLITVELDNVIQRLGRSNTMRRVHKSSVNLMLLIFKGEHVVRKKNCNKQAASLLSK